MKINYSAYGTSYNEQLIYLSLKYFFEDAENRCRVLRDKIQRGLEFDIGIPSIPLCIEYSPTSTHGGKRGNGGTRDLIKREICKEYNIKFIEIIEDTYNELEHYMQEDKYCFCDRHKLGISIYDIIDDILKNLGKDINELDIDSIKTQAYKRSHSMCDESVSISSLYPKLACEWGNNTIKPNEISPYSHHYIYWKCTHCNYGNNGEWKIRPVDRVNYKSGCPYCGWNVFSNKYIKVFTDVVYNGNDLYSINKELIELEWDFTRNTEDPKKIKATTHNSYYWHCEKCGYGNNGEWKVSPKSRITQQQGCIKCGWNIFKHAYNKLNKNKYMTKNLVNTYPELAKEFNEKLNNITADKISPGYSSKVYWTCIKCGYGSNGEWSVKPNSRTYNKNGCPNCKENWFRRMNNGSKSTNNVE